MTNDQITNLTASLPQDGIALINWQRQSDTSRGAVTAKGDLQSKGQFATARVWAKTVKVLRANAGHLYVKALKIDGGWVNARVVNINSISIA